MVVLDLRRVSDAADFFVLCTGTSEPHVRSLSDELVERLVAAGHRPWHVEGAQARRWVLVDLVDIAVHIFRREAREYYDLERLWGDAEVTRFDDAWDAVGQDRPAAALAPRVR